MPSRPTASLLLTISTIACAALFGAAPATAQPASAPAASAAATRVDNDDRDFIQKAGMGGMAEVALGNLAQTRAADPAVKTFASQMVSDHGSANDELSRIASAKGVQIPPPDRKHKKEAEQLGKKNGADFDKAYMKHMVDEHKKTIKLFEKGARSAKDADVRAFAGETLPTLQMHLQHAQKTYDAVKK